MGKEKKPKEKKEKKSLLGTIADLATEAKFELIEMKLRGMIWTLKLKVATQLPDAHRNYAVKLFLDEQPYTDRIESIQRDLKQGLFKDSKEEEADAKRRIDEINDELEGAKEMYQTIEFAATLTELKYVTGGTQIVAAFDQEAVAAINERKGDLREYKISLNPTA